MISNTNNWYSNDETQKLAPALECKTSHIMSQLATTTEVSNLCAKQANVAS